MKIKLDDGAFVPTRAHEHDGGMDLYAMEDQIVPAKESAIFDTGGRTHASAALWHIESVNKARHVFVAPDMDVLNKKVRSKGEQK